MQTKLRNLVGKFFANRYVALATILTLLAIGTLAGYGLELTGATVPYIVLLPAIILAVDLYGFRGGAIAAAIGTVLAWYGFVDPVWTFVPPSWGDGLSLVTFLGVALFVAMVVGALRLTILDLERPKGEGSA